MTAPSAARTLNTKTRRVLLLGKESLSRQHDFTLLRQTIAKERTCNWQSYYMTV